MSSDFRIEKPDLLQSGKVYDDLNLVLGRLNCDLQAAA